MATALTRTYLRGLLIPDPRLTYEGAYSSTLSTATQAGPMPGEAVASQETFATLVATGEQSGTTVEVQTLRAGMPGLEGAGFVWRDQGATLWRGWDVPQTLTGWGSVRYTTTANDYRDAVILSTADDGLLIAYEDQTGGSVRASRRAASASSWSDVQVFSHALTIGAVYTTGAKPALVQLPSGRVLVFYCVEDSTSSTVDVWMSYSDDDGATWTTGQRYCLASSISTASKSVRRMRAAYYGGQIVLLIDIIDTSTAYSQRLAQYASADLGASFQLVDQYSGADIDNHGGFGDVVAVADGFMIAYVRRENHATYGLLNRPWSRRIGSAYSLFSSATEVRMQDASNPMSWATGTTSWADGEMALGADDVGRVYAVGRDFAVTGLDAIALRYTADYGDSQWSGTGSSSHPTTKAMIWRGQSGSTHPRYLATCWQRGRLVMSHQHNSVAATAEASIAILTAGGWATVPMPSLTGPVTHDGMATWERTWLPYDLPQTQDATSWAYTSTGAPTVALGSAGMTITGGIGDSATWTGSPTGSMAQGLIAEGWVSVTTGAATVRVRAGVAGPDSFEASIVATPTTISLLDVTGAVTIATVNTTAATTGVWLRIAVGCRLVSGNNGRTTAWYAPGARGDAEDRAWVEVGNSNGLVQGTSTTHRVQFSAGVGSGVAVNQTWRSMTYVSDQYAGTGQTQIYTPPANPTDLLPRDLAPTPVYAVGGLEVYGTDGPAYRSDTWTIATDYRYPVRAVHIEEEPSPRRTWRSTTTASEQIIAWEIDPTVTSPFFGPDRCLHLAGINFRTAYWEGGDGAGVWQLIATVDAASGQTGLGYVRDDEIVTTSQALGSGAIAGRMLLANELAGARFVMSGGTRVRPISMSTPGVWAGALSGDGTKVRARIRAVSTDPTSGIDGEIWMSSVTVVAAETTTVEYSAYRLRIPVQTTYEGFFEVGCIVQGYLHIFATQYSASRAQSMTPAYELTEVRGGARRVQRTGPARRAVEIAWEEGVDGTAIARNDVDYVRLHAGGGGIASPADVAPSLLGLMEQLDGAVTPIVYLPQIATMTGGTTVRTIISPYLQLYGRIRSETLQVDTVQGSEFEDPSGEVYRVARVRIEEEL